MKQPTRRARTLGTVLVTPVAILAAAGMVWQSSYSAFSGTTRNSDNNWSTGSVALTDDDSGTARFQATNLVPDDTDTKCLAVTAHADVEGVVKAYAINLVPSAQKLEDHIIVSVDYGTGGGFSSCTGFTSGGTAIPPTTLTNLAAYSNYANGAGSWAVAAGEQTRTYKITWRFDTTGMTQTELNGLQGASTGIDFQWELQTS